MGQATVAHGQGPVRNQRVRQPVNQGRVNEGFVSLDIDHMSGGGEACTAFPPGGRAAGMVRRGHDRLGAKGHGGVEDALVVRGDGDVVKAGAAGNAFPYVLDKRFSWQ